MNSRYRDGRAFAALTCPAMGTTQLWRDVSAADIVAPSHKSRPGREILT